MSTPDDSPTALELETTISRRGFLAGGVALGALGPLVDTSAAIARPVRAPHPAHHRHRKTKPVPGRSTPGLPAPGPIAAAHADPADLGLLQAASLLQAELLSSVRADTWGPRHAESLGGVSQPPRRAFATAVCGVRPVRWRSPC